MNSNPIFVPVQGSEKQIQKSAVQEGWLYIATDSGRMYLDTETGRIKVGGSGDGSGGVGLHYGESKKPVKDNELYSILKTEVQGSFPQLGDLILNSDGGFYKVVDITDEAYICSLMSVSGTGDGTGPAKAIPSLILDDFYDVNIINGSDVNVSFVATSANDAQGVPYAKQLTITWKLFDGDSKTGTMYQSSTFTANSGEKKSFNFGPYLRESTTSTL